jgi:hypothetical protein
MRANKMNFESNNNICPFVKNPFSECYCFNMTSKNIDTAINYCGNKFSKCEIYKNNSYLKKNNNQRTVKAS